jgi:phosphoribosylanthranilate isomerase
LAIIREARLDLAQFHGPQDLKVAEMVGPERVIRVFWPERLTLKELAADLDKWREAAALYLFDAGRSLGGHGQKLTNLNFGSPKAYLLAGGLSPPDLGRLWPGSEPNFSGFDFNSGLESAPGVKDQAAIASLFQVRAAYSQGLDGSVATRG